MTLLGFDGFDYFSSTATVAAAQLAGRGWTPGGSHTRTTGRFGGFAVNSGSPQFNFPNNATVIVGAACFAASSPLVTVVTLGDAGSPQAGWGVTAGGKFMIFRLSAANILGTGTLPVPINSWFYVELKMTIHNTAGTAELRVNGSPTPDISLTGLNTRSTANNFANDVWFNAANFPIDDFYALDPTTGAAPYNDFLGDVRIQTLFASAAGSSTQWTPLSTTNFSNVDDAGLDGDTTYNSSTTAGQIDLFACADLTGTPVVLGVQAFVDARKDDAGLRQVRTKLKSGAVTSNGATATLNSSNYANYADRYLTDPNTSAAWTVAAVNALEVGYENI